MNLLRKILLLTIVFILIGLLSWALALHQGWSLWSIAVILTATVGIYLTFIFVKRLWIWLRARSQITKVKSSHTTSTTNALSLKEKWKNSISLIKKSGLKRKGNPVDALPWYMVIGHSGDGKTSALARSRLSLPIMQKRKMDEITSTLNCDWWYFENSIVLDCAGRYVESDCNEKDSQEWDLNLDLLAQFRRKEGLNGLVLVISVERLLSPNTQGIEDEALFLRGRIEQLIRLFNKRFPIYVLITKCDQIYGFESWIHHLSENQISQVMGYTQADLDNEIDTEYFLNEAFSSILSRLKQSRIKLIDSHPEMASKLLIFPAELENIHPKLEIFLNACLGTNPYLELPLLRGIFFSSSRQDGGAKSQLLSQILAEPKHEETHTGIFLRDFFDNLLPKDKSISQPAKIRNFWYTVTHNIGIAAWLLLILSIAAILTISFVRNINTVTAVQHSYPANIQWTGNLSKDSLTLLEISKSIEELEKNNNHYISRFLADRSTLATLEEDLKNNYQELYNRYILPSTEGSFYKHVEKLLINDPNKDLPILILSQIRYTNLIQAKVHGAEISDLESMPRIPYDGSQEQSKDAVKLHNNLVDLFISHLAWTEKSSPKLIERLGKEQSSLLRISSQGQPFSWAPPLVKRIHPEIPDIKLSYFWGGNSNPSENLSDIEIPAMHTRAGAERISSWIHEYSTASNNGPKFLGDKATFNELYLQSRFQSWKNFIARFPEGERLLNGEKQWRSLLNEINDDNSPYFKLIDVLKDEFSDVDSSSYPEWLKIAIWFSKLRQEEKTTKNHGENGQLISAINATGGKAIRQTLNGNPHQGKTTINDHIDEVTTLRTLIENVNTAAIQAAAGPGSAYQAAVDLYAFGIDTNAEKESPLTLALKDFEKLRAMHPPLTPDQEDIWRLIAGPSHFTMRYMNQQASCSLQSEWESQVLWPMQSVGSTEEAVDLLYGIDGSVWKFTDTLAKPFLVRSSTNFSPRTAFNNNFPLTQGYISNLNTSIGKRIDQIVLQQESALKKQRKLIERQEQQQQQKIQSISEKQKKSDIESILAEQRMNLDNIKNSKFLVQITAQPTGVNKSSAAQPYQTTLSIQCSKNTFTLNNFNFPVSTNFEWSASDCGDTSLKINIDNIVLEKKYIGPLSFVDFLQDFRDGKHIFKSTSFPRQMNQLEKLNIQEISLRFNLEGATKIISAASQINEIIKSIEQSKDKLQQAQQSILLSEMKSSDEITPENEISDFSRRPFSHILKDVALPHQIGVCWKKQSMASSATQSLQQMLKSMSGDKILSSRPGSL